VNVIELFDDSARRFADRPALVHGPRGAERTLTFAALAEQSRRLAALFRSSGLQAGDALAVFVPMSAQLYAIMAAALRLGLVAVFVEPGGWKDDIASCARHLRLRGFVGTTTAFPLACAPGRALPGATPLGAANRHAPLDGRERCAPDSTAMVTFTSGSTGKPKGVLRSHAVLAATQSILRAELQTQPGELAVPIIPFFVFSNLAAGVPSLLLDVDLGKPAAIPAPRVAEQIRRLAPRSMVASPAFVDRLADWCLGADARLPSLQRVYVGGAPVFPCVLDKLAQIAPAAQIRSLYGATEAEPIAVMRYEEWSPALREQARSGRGIALGTPVPGVTVRIQADDISAPSRSPLSTADVGAAGEILVAGAHVAAGYLGGEGDRDNTIDDGGVRWHRTGDAGTRDATSRLWMVGRRGARIDDAHGAIYPLAVEAALSFLPGAPRAALVGWQSRRVLVLDADAGRGRGMLATLLAAIPWAQVDEIALMRRIPVDRRHNAKVDYRALRRALENGAAVARISASELPAHAASLANDAR
jgi:acyl-CoA synthetase (AMP-forming)/AMP-acid ligase II